MLPTIPAFGLGLALAAAPSQTPADSARVVALVGGTVIDGTGAEGSGG